MTARSPHRGQPHAQRADEAGFTLVETLVALGIVAIMMVFLVPDIMHAQKSSDPSVINAAASAMWDAVDEWRIDHRGELPGAHVIDDPGGSTNANTTFVDLSGSKYLKTWPQVPHGEGDIPVIATSGYATPPTSVPAADKKPNGEIVYQFGSPEPSDGWLAGYDSTGQLVFSRQVGGTGAEAPGSLAVVPTATQAAKLYPPIG